VITSVDGQPITEWEQLTTVTRASPGQTVVLGVDSGEGPRDVEVKVATAYRPVVDAEGQATEEVTVSGYLGVAPQSKYVPQPWSAVPATVWDLSVRSVQAMVTLPVRVYELARDMFTGEERDPESPVSVIGVGRLSGEVAAAEEPVKSKVVILVSLMAGLNLFLFLFNLVPLLPLDGGHVAGAVWEGIRRRVAAWRGLPDPGPVDVSRALPLAYVVGFTLIALSSIVILADVINPISLYG
jgi:membrane-associated protease RseP (regulator of RpoE activity)